MYASMASTPRRITETVSRQAGLPLSGIHRLVHSRHTPHFEAHRSPRTGLLSATPMRQSCNICLVLCVLFDSSPIDLAAHRRVRGQCDTGASTHQGIRANNRDP